MLDRSLRTSNKNCLFTINRYSHDSSVANTVNILALLLFLVGMGLFITGGLPLIPYVRDNNPRDQLATSDIALLASGGASEILALLLLLGKCISQRKRTGSQMQIVLEKEMQPLRGTQSSDDEDIENDNFRKNTKNTR